MAEDEICIILSILVSFMGRKLFIQQIVFAFRFFAQFLDYEKCDALQEMNLQKRY